MPGPRRVYIVDDNIAMAAMARTLLERAGYAVSVSQSGARALEEIPAQRPDCVILDILMPEIDGIEVCRRLRQLPGLQGTKIIMFTSKSFKYDRARAAEVGADGYILKPLKPESFLEQVRRIVEDEIELRFWGVRGTLPRPGPEAVRYGGNTCCVSLEFPGDRLFVLDAGTGIKRLADQLMASGARRIQGRILLTHPHWDHINAIPFFTPLYVTGNQFEILGASHGESTTADLVSAQMHGVFFPITVREFGAHVTYRDIHEGRHEIDGIELRAMLLSHPGNCLGYRFDYGGRSVCYVTDNELFPPESEFYNEDYVEALAKFVEGTEALLIDAAYSDAEYPNRIGFGHSAVSQVAHFAHRARAQTLYLIHHDPDQDDAAIDRKLAAARDLLAQLGSSTRCEAPAELDRVLI
jgi:CheY-like chemotaxis protein